MRLLFELTDIELENILLNNVQKVRMIEADILRVLSEVKRRKLDKQQGFANLASFCESRLGLSKDQAWKRSQATSVIEIAPKALELLESGKTHVSGLALIAPKITDQNQEQILNFLPGASKSDLMFLLQTIDRCGNKIEVEPTISVQLKFSRETFENLEKLQGLLVQTQIRAGKKVNKENTIEQAINNLLEKMDPAKKQERREKRQTKNHDKKEKSIATIKKKSVPTEVKRSIPESLRAAVLKRDNYQCSHINIFDEQCQEKSVLQIDHVKPWAIGGGHELINLRTVCPAHNLLLADQVFGEKFMECRKKKQKQQVVTRLNGLSDFSKKSDESEEIKVGQVKEEMTMPTAWTACAQWGKSFES